MYAVVLLVTCVIDLVDAVAVDYVERFYGECCFAVAIVAAYAALESELSAKFFERIRAVKWTAESIEGHLNDIGLKDPLARSEARAMLLDHCSSRGESTAGSSVKTESVKKEPSVVGNEARVKALAENESVEVAEVKAKVAEAEQEGKNELIECFGFYAKAMRAVGSEGLALDKAMAGEDPDNVTLSGEGGSGLKVKTLGSKCVADAWKTVEDANNELAEMISRAQSDEKFFIVKRLNNIQNTCHRLTPAQKLPYLKKLFTKSYKGIPEADNKEVMLKVEREWKMSLETRGGQGSGSSDNQAKKEIADLKAEIANLKKSKAAPAGKEERGELKCYLCGGKGHHIRNCPDQCKVCSTATKHVLKTECKCEEK